MKAYRNRKSGFTLVEILIVVIILGILAAIVIPQFTSASEDARKSSMTSQLQTLRSQVELYKLQHRDSYPTTDGTADVAKWDWTKLTGKTNDDGSTTGTPQLGPYLQVAPINPLTNSGTIAAAAGTGVGFVFEASTGKLFGVNKDGTQATD